jgi:hypothetical protein
MRHKIWDIGKRLIDYKMTREPSQKAVKTQATTINTLQLYLKDKAAVLVN